MGSRRENAHLALQATGMTPAYGNIADAADALLYAVEGEYGKAVVSLAAMLPVAGQLVAAKRATKALKQMGEETVTLYRGYDKWFPGRMVKKGKFTGRKYKKHGGTGEYANVDLAKKTTDHIFVTPDINYAKAYTKKTVRKPGRYSRGSKSQEISDEGVLLEFEVPISWMRTHVSDDVIYKVNSWSYGNQWWNTPGWQASTFEKFNEFRLDGGIPKGFLKKVHNVKDLEKVTKPKMYLPPPGGLKKALKRNKKYSADIK